MNWLKIVNKYVIPVVIYILLFAFFAWAVSLQKEGFKNNCECETGTHLKNGGCYLCENGYKLSDNYYNVFCVSENPNDLNTPKYIKSAKVKKPSC